MRSSPRSGHRQGDPRSSTGTKEAGRRGGSRSTGRRDRAQRADGLRRAPFAPMPRVIGGGTALSSKEVTPGMIGPSSTSCRRPAQAPLSRSASTTTSRSQPADRRRLPHATPRGRGGGVLSARLRRHGRPNHALGEDHRRRHGPLRPGLLRVRLQESRAGPRLAPALRPRAHAIGLPDRPPPDFNRLPPVRAPRQDQDLDFAKPGATFLLNSPYGPAENWDHLSADVQKLLVDKKIDFLGHRRPRRGRRERANGQPDQHDHAALLLSICPACCPSAEAIERIKEFVHKTYNQARPGGRGTELRRHRRLDRRAWATSRSARPGRPCASAVVPDSAPDFVKNVTAVSCRRRRTSFRSRPSDRTGRTRWGTTNTRKRAIALGAPDLGSPRSDRLRQVARWSARTPRIRMKGLPAGRHGGRRPASSPRSSSPATC